jgi:hypothetical protein
MEEGGACGERWLVGIPELSILHESGVFPPPFRNMRSVGLIATLRDSGALPFVIPTGAEGSAVQRPSHSNPGSG